MPTNEFGQPIGDAIRNWSPRQLPDGSAVSGRLCRVLRLSPNEHEDSLYEIVSADDASAWTYMTYGPFNGKADFREWLVRACAQRDPFFYAIVDAASNAIKGFASFLRIKPNAGAIEVGNVYFSHELRRKPAATEAMYLMMRYAMDDLGYRRYEWKCDALNAPSRAAAARLGFTYEGIFRQATIYKGRSRDTAWFSITDGEWPAVKQSLEQWLAPVNFDEAGRQRQPLRAYRP